MTKPDDSHSLEHTFKGGGGVGGCVPSDMFTDIVANCLRLGMRGRALFVVAIKQRSGIELDVRLTCCKIVRSRHQSS